jgi:hypothetical protein
VVGEADGGLLECRRSLDQRVDLAGAVQQRVLGMDVEVDAGRGQGGGSAQPMSLLSEHRCRLGWRAPQRGF